MPTELHPSSARSPGVDGLRGIAIAMVVVWHYVENTGLLRQVGPWAEYLLGDAFSMFWTGVDLFFVVSGFLIGGILMDRRHEPRAIRQFFLRRCFRILPLYVVLLAGFAVASALVDPVPGRASGWLVADPLPPWTYATMTQNVAMAAEHRFGPNWLAITWSLAIEEQFYLLAPLLIAFVPARLLPWLVLAGLPAGIVARVALYENVGGMAAYALLPARMDGLLLGILCAWAVRQPGLHRRLQDHRVVLGVFALSLLALVAALAHRDVGIGKLAPSWFGYTLFAALYATLLLLAVSGRVGAIMASKALAPLRAAGVGCFSLYLLHQPVLGLAFLAFSGEEPAARSAADVATIAVALLALVALAAMTWRFVEAPAIALGRRLGHPGKERAVAPAPFGPRGREPGRRGAGKGG